MKDNASFERHYKHTNSFMKKSSLSLYLSKYLDKRYQILSQVNAIKKLYYLNTVITVPI